MKTATITFHASYNYGSMLQAYALQQFLLSNNVDNEIINLRTEVQKDKYALYTKRKGVKFLLKNLAHFVYKRDFQKKYDSFEMFLKEFLKLTELEFATSKQIADNKLNYDFYISGGDQIWNPVPSDFDWAYYLEFVQQGKKIAFSTSFGQLSSIGDENVQKRIRKNLNEYDFISVREFRSFDNVFKLTNKEPKITVDSIFLLNADCYKSIERKVENLPKNGYILFYSLFPTKKSVKIAKKISSKYNLPVIVTGFSNQFDVVNSFKKVYSCGPLEFLYLLDHASMVVTTSFHGVAFSILFDKVFWAIDGDSDARISHLLKLLKLSDRSISSYDYSFDYFASFNYEEMIGQLKLMVDESTEFLLGSLGLQNEN